jgi:hypothetical protein
VGGCAWTDPVAGSRQGSAGQGSTTPKQAHRALMDTQRLNELRSGDRLRAEFVCGLGDAREDVEREQAPESIHEGRCDVGGIFVKLDDPAR